VPDASVRAAIQRALARRHPNISTLDLALLQRTLADILDRVVLAIRFMALFAVAAGAIVLAGALAAGRHQRTREAVLLRTLGATRAVVRRVLFTEYAALGALAGLTGTLLGLIAGWSLTRFFFEMPFHVPAAPLAFVAIAVALLAVLIGAAGNRRILERPPLETLREAV
jgi:putative ABC transport system permease protein